MIERGNKDGSWNCSHPKETANFIMYGMSGEPTAPKEITMNIILKVLGFTEKQPVIIISPIPVGLFKLTHIE